MKHLVKTHLRPTVLIAAVLGVMICVGCDDTRKTMVEHMNRKAIDRNEAVERKLHQALGSSTNAQVQAWREFLLKWPTARQHEGFAWHDDVKAYKGNISATTLLQDRYVFKVILDFEMGPDLEIVKFTMLRFHLAEVKAVVLPSEGAGEGGVLVSFGRNQTWFGLQEWQRLVASRWNFSVLGVTVVSNAPIKNIHSALPAL